MSRTNLVCLVRRCGKGGRASVTRHYTQIIAARTARDCGILSARPQNQPMLLVCPKQTRSLADPAEYDSLSRCASLSSGSGPDVSHTGMEKARTMSYQVFAL